MVCNTIMSMNLERMPSRKDIEEVSLIAHELKVSPEHYEDIRGFISRTEPLIEELRQKEVRGNVILEDIERDFMSLAKLLEFSGPEFELVRDSLEKRKKESRDVTFLRSEYEKVVKVLKEKIGDI